MVIEFLNLEKIIQYPELTQVLPQRIQSRVNPQHSHTGFGKSLEGSEWGGSGGSG